MRFERVTTKDHTGKRETLCLQILSEDGSWLRGLKVNTRGDDTESHYDGDTLVVVERLIDKGTITKRIPLTMNNTYGELEEA